MITVTGGFARIGREYTKQALDVMQCLLARKGEIEIPECASAQLQQLQSIVGKFPEDTDEIENGWQPRGQEVIGNGFYELTWFGTWTKFRQVTMVFTSKDIFLVWDTGKDGGESTYFKQIGLYDFIQKATYQRAAQYHTVLIESFGLKECNRDSGTVLERYRSYMSPADVLEKEKWGGETWGQRIFERDPASPQRLT